MIYVSFKPDISRIADVEVSTINRELLLQEPMIFNGSVDFAIKNSGPIVKELCMTLVRNKLLQNIPGGYNWIVDTKTVMVMRGQYPSIPGWHCDGVPRGPSTNGQPDTNAVNDSIYHYLAVVGNPASISNTEFVTEELTIPVKPGNVWGSVDHFVSYHAEDIHRMSVEDSAIYKFNRAAIHRAVPATENGWRIFFRCSQMPQQPKNQIRHQVTVYTDPANGW